jgi:hypothetical protein
MSSVAASSFLAEYSLPYEMLFPCSSSWTLITTVQKSLLREKLPDKVANRYAAHCQLRALRDGRSILCGGIRPSMTAINESGRALHLADDLIKSAVCTQLKIWDRISRQNPVEIFLTMNIKKCRNVNNQFD